MSLSPTTARSRKTIRGGYRKHHPFLNWLFEKALTVPLLGLALPVMAVIALLIKIQDGGPVFYASRRLGRHKIPFDMYKFRTLVPDADQRLADIPADQRHGLETRLGRFLRETRLDELPQLFNILRGDMTYFGPRPIRPEVYETQCRTIPDFDQRFAIKPGLTGYSQLFMPYDAPKRLRAIIDNTYSRRDQNILYDLLIVLFTLGYLTGGAIEHYLKRLWMRLVVAKRLGKAIERRTLARVRPKGVRIQIFEGEDEHGTFTGPAMLGDINDECMLVYTEQALREDSPLFVHLTLRRPPALGRGAKFKTARCTARVFRVRDTMHLEGPKHAYILAYRAISPFNRYILNQYFIRKSIV